MIGASIYDILTPDSREALRNLMKKLVQSDDSSAAALADNEKGDKQGRHDPFGSVAVVSDQSSFPLSVVKVKSKQSTMDENDTSDGSAGGKQQASLSLTNSTNSGSEDGAEDPSHKIRKKGTNVSTGSQNVNISRRLSSSDESSTETKNLRTANENLDRNVRWHNITLQSKSKSSKSKAGHKDDVTGASVTANNASARLSSLQHVPASVIANNISNMLPSLRRGTDHSSSDDSLLTGAEEKKKQSNGNSSDDSGYRESNESREETSSTSNSLNSNGKKYSIVSSGIYSHLLSTNIYYSLGRQKPLAPTCNVCLIRSNLTKLWCEVTSSIRNQSSGDDDDDSEDLTNSTLDKSGQPKSSSTGSKTSKSSASTSEDTPPPKEIIKEILLCLRPIRDGDNEVDASLRFNPLKEVTPTKTQTSSSSPVDQSNEGSTSSNPNTSKLPKKHIPVLLESNGIRKKRMRIMTDSPIRDSETEKSVVESLMLMSNKSK